MLPSELLIARIQRGRIRPVYAKAEGDYVELASALIAIYEGGVGRRKGEIWDTVKGYEEAGFDYRFVRGLALLLERRCSFVLKSGLNSSDVRRLVFGEASRRRAIPSPEERVDIIAKVAGGLGVSAGEVEESLYGDLEEQSVLKEFRPIKPDDLLRQYNLSLTQTLLFKSTSLKFTAKGNWNRIFRQIKFFGLMYSAEARPEGLCVTVDGPLSLFKLTERYGTSMAKLLPAIVASDGWTISASIVKGGEVSGGRILGLELGSGDVGPLIKLPPSTEGADSFDSSVEERFARRFRSLGTGWKVAREPEPLTVGTHVFIPDFSFQKDGTKVYMEIVGFWTQEYLERKIQKLQQLGGVDLIVAVNEGLACSKLGHIRGKVLFYKTAVPPGQVFDLLKEFEEIRLARQTTDLKNIELNLEGEIVELAGIASGLGVSTEALKRIIKTRSIAPSGEGGQHAVNVVSSGRRYRLIGDTLVRDDKLAGIEAKLSTLKEKTLLRANDLIQGEGLGSPDLILGELGYAIKWHGLDMGKATISKKA
jgi:predicted nuclease of restriction endonuclease-like RecB superfamily